MAFSKAFKATESWIWSFCRRSTRKSRDFSCVTKSWKVLAKWRSWSIEQHSKALRLKVLLVFQEKIQWIFDFTWDICREPIGTLLSIVTIYKRSSSFQRDVIWSHHRFELDPNVRIAFRFRLSKDHISILNDESKEQREHIRNQRRVSKIVQAKITIKVERVESVDRFRFCSIDVRLFQRKFCFRLFLLWIHSTVLIRLIPVFLRNVRFVFVAIRIDSKFHCFVEKENSVLVLPETFSSFHGISKLFFRDRRLCIEVVRCFFLSLKQKELFSKWKITVFYFANLILKKIDVFSEFSFDFLHIVFHFFTKHLNDEFLGNFVSTKIFFFTFVHFT